MFSIKLNRFKIALIFAAIGVLMYGGWALAQRIFGMGVYPGGTLHAVFKFERADIGPSTYTMDVKPNGDKFDIFETVVSQGRKPDEVGSGFGASGAAGAARIRFEPNRGENIDLSPLAVLDEKEIEVKPNDRYLLPDGAVLQTGGTSKMAGIDVINGVYTHPSFPTQRVLIAFAPLEIKKLLLYPPFLERQKDGKMFTRVTLMEFNHQK